ncbi:MAG: hypothetical protein R2761_02370 [Acidimicrobiales bacterium]
MAERVAAWPEPSVRLLIAPIGRMAPGRVWGCPSSWSAEVGDALADLGHGLAELVWQQDLDL